MEDMELIITGSYLKISDANDIALLIILTRNEMQIYYEEFKLLFDETQFIKNIKDGRYTFLLKINKKIIGYAQYFIENKSLYVSEIHSEIKNKGVGSILVNHILNYANLNNVKTIKLRVFKKNPAKFFFEKYKFECVGEEDFLFRYERVL